MVKEDTQAKPAALVEPEAVDTAQVTKPVSTEVKTVKKTNEDFNKVMASNMSGDRRQNQEQALEKIKEFFPQLKEEIESFQSETNKQNDKLSQYKQLTAKRNALVKDGHQPDELIQELKEQREALLVAARVLGERGMEINKAIRDAAEEYERNL